MTTQTSRAMDAAPSTRERVRIAVSEHGPVTAAELGQRMNLTPASSEWCPEL